MKNFIPSFTQCVEIVAANPAFDHTRQEVDGYTVHVFNYNLPGYMDFVEPIKGRPEINALELRGLTFIEDNGTIYGPYLMLNKFWCLNQTKGAMLQDVKDQPIHVAQDKADGSLIRFLHLPNGRIIAKSKGAILNPHTDMAETLLEKNPALKEWVRDCHYNSVVPYFEMVSPEFQVVLEYKEPELVLVQMRNEKTGEYLNIYETPVVRDLIVRAVTRFEFIKTWEDVLFYQRTQRGVEGLVLTLPTGLLKVKTDWYENMHRHVMKKDYSDKAFIEMIVDETIDDALGFTDPQSAAYARMTELSNKVGHWFNGVVREVDTILAANDFAADDKQARGVFAREFNKHPLFDFLIIGVQNRNLDRAAFLKEMKNVVRRCIKNEAETVKFLKRIA